MKFSVLQNRLLDALRTHQEAGKITQEEFNRLYRAVMFGITESIQEGYRLFDI